MLDTGHEVKVSQTQLYKDEHDDYEFYMGELAEIGVPFAPDGTPLGVGWDD